MMTEARKGAYWNALRLAAEGAPIPEFIAAASKAKEEIGDAFYLLWQETNVLDNLVAQLAPELAWTPGVASAGRDNFGRLIARMPVATIQKATAANRAARIIGIVEALVDDGATTVQSATIAETLQQEGWEGTARNLSVSIGNVLARTKSWKRIRSGEYLFLG